VLFMKQILNFYHLQGSLDFSIFSPIGRASTFFLLDSWLVPTHI